MGGSETRRSRRATDFIGLIFGWVDRVVRKEAAKEPVADETDGLVSEPRAEAREMENLRISSRAALDLRRSSASQRFVASERGRNIATVGSTRRKYGGIFDGHGGALGQERQRGVTGIAQ